VVSTMQTQRLWQVWKLETTCEENGFHIPKKRKKLTDSIAALIQRSLKKMNFRLYLRILMSDNPGTNLIQCVNEEDNDSKPAGTKKTI